MKPRILTISLSLSILAALSGFASPADIVPAMASLDKKYIPALGLSGQPNQVEKAKIAFAAFEASWDDFRQGPAAQAGFDDEWMADLTRIGLAVDMAKSALFVNSSAPAAHEALEAVRKAFLESRQRQKMAYFLDYLTLFHGSMEDLLADKPSAKAGEWSSSEKMAFTADLDIAIARWNKVKAMETLLPDYSLAPTAKAVYFSQWQAISSLMSGIKKALEANDGKAFAERLAQLKPNFIKTFFLFGDFPG